MPRKRDFLERQEPDAARQERLAHRKVLRSWTGIQTALPKVDAQFIRNTREKLECSRALFARRLFMSVGGGERMGHFGGPEGASPPRVDGGEVSPGAQS